LGRTVVPLIPATDFAGPPTPEGPMPGRVRVVPLIAPRFRTAGLTTEFVFDVGRPNALPVLARPPLAPALKPVVAAAGLCTRAGRSCRWPSPCSVPSWRTTGTPIASRVTRLEASCADSRRG